MKIGVSAFAWTTKVTASHLRLLPSLREQGLEGLEIPMFDPADLPVHEIRRAFEINRLGCTVCAILPPGINPVSPDPVVRKNSVAHLLRCIEASAEMGAQLLGGPLFAPLGYLPARRRSEDEWKWAVEIFQTAGEALDANQITLSIEPVNRAETFFLRTAEEAKALCKEINNPRVGVTLDTFHANIEEKEIVGAIRRLDGYLRHLHVSENDRGLLGSGHIDFPEIVTTLREIGYRDWLMIEGFGFSREEQGSPGTIFGYPDVTPEDIAFKGALYLRTLLDESDPGSRLDKSQ